MKPHHILIDYENVAVKSLALLKGDNFRVYVFLGPKNTKISVDLAEAMQQLGSHAEYIRLDAGGHNALDFHITYYLGKLAAAEPNGVFYIISKDTGFDSLIKHIKQSNINCTRVISIDAIPGMPKTTVQKTVANTVAKVAPAPKAPAKKAIAAKQNKKDLVEKIIANFTKRAASLPRTEKALRTTLVAVCGTQYSAAEVEALFKALVKNGYVVQDGTKVSYNLP